MMGPFRRLARLIDQGRQLDAALASDPFALPAPETRHSVQQLHGLYPRRHPGLYAPVLGTGLVALGGGACAWLLFNSRAMQRYMELAYAQRLYRAQAANRPGSAQRRLANQAAYRERKRRERSGRA
ncbi:hypothetical protein G039_0323335 [Pseudomonas aeruginosa VRFPA01]|nr:hypothetical protein G039_0323335 [Pseudomonas aeruginosa VRFPA01]